MLDTSTKRLVLDLLNYKVEERNGIKTVVFQTLSGRGEVLFQRNKQGYVVKITNLPVETVCLAAARNLCLPLLRNVFLEKGSRHTTKVVDTPQQERRGVPATCQQTQKPSWLNPAMAASHEAALKTYTDDE